MQTIRLISFTLFFLFSLAGNAAFGLSERCAKAHELILCLRFDEARGLIGEEKRLNPVNTQPYLLENYIDFLMVMIGEEERDYAHLKQNRNFRLGKLASGDATSPWYRYSQAVVYMQCGFARVKFRDYVTAGLELNQAFRLLEENNKKFPYFIPNNTSLGLLHALIGTVPDNYNWAVRTLNFKGTIRQGINELQSAYQQSARSEEYSFNFPESAFLLAFATINLAGNKTAALNFINESLKPPLQQWVHNSPLMNYAAANIYLKTGSNDKAIAILKQVRTGKLYYPFHYLDYVLGVAKLNRLDKDANVPLLSFVATFKGLNYIKAAYEHIAWYYLINGNTDKYRLYLERISQRGNIQVDNDREALRHTRLKESQNIYLLKARLLFDGGYYEKALAEVHSFEQICTDPPHREIVECTYRKGRIYDEWGKEEQAIANFKSTINLGNNLPNYYAANASLHLGLIYENLNDFKQAKYYYGQCLSFDFEEYHFSITHKAKAGLNRLSGK